MRHHLITEGPDWRLARWGGGTLYTLTQINGGSSVTFQGDDATQFEREYSDLEKFHPTWTNQQICAFIWDQCGYSEVANRP